MCGIAGFWQRDGGRDAAQTLAAMAAAIHHRGPDDSGTWVEETHGLAFAHRRLSIVDLSPAGHQPMGSASGRYTIIFNGEIYNYPALRSELETRGVRAWRGHSDTEILLEAIEQWGLEATLARLVGMFAFALWDAAAATLTLARDRVGEKPLYYGWMGQAFLFGSDLAALTCHPAWRGEIDRGALALLLRHNCIPAPYSIYRHIHKLRPGHYVTLAAGQREPQGVCYWDAAAVTRDAVPFTGSNEEAVAQTEALLRQSIQGQMQADVPVGAFLSGGVDSSTVVALMQAMSGRPVHSFSIGFGERDYDEAQYAKAVAAHLGTAHTELYVTPDDAMAVIEKLPEMYSEPFADVSQIPTYLVAQLARQKVTVSLSGDGGDELFSGYNRYALVGGAWGKLSVLPSGVRRAMAAGVTQISPALWDKIAAVAQLGVAPAKRHGRVGDKLHKFADILAAADSDTLYRQLTSQVRAPEALVLGASEPPTLLTGLDDAPRFAEPVRQMMVNDLRTYLPDDILVKLDRATMAVSLESRVPLLDHRLIAFAASLPVSMLRQGGVGKWPLRQVLYQYVPQSLIERPKAGFGVPIDQWLRGPLKAWAAALLAPALLPAQGYFAVEAVQQMWDEHQSGARNWQYQLWPILMFQAWLACQTQRGCVASAA